MHLEDLAKVSRDVAATAARLEKIGRLAEALREAGPDEVAIAVAWLTGELRQGRIGIGPATIEAARPDHAAAVATLTLSEVDRQFALMAGATGAGSTAERIRQLASLLQLATAIEQQFLLHLVYGELRQGALEGVMADAIGRAAHVPAERVRRAVMFAGDLGRVAHAALAGGEPALTGFGLQLFRPLQPMLAETAEDCASALVRFGSASLEYKLDGARIQVHRSGDDVRIYTRNLNDVTASAPEIVDVVRALPVRELVLDGEALALREDGWPLPFQVTMRRFGRTLDVESMRHSLPLRPFFFDILHVDGSSLIDLAARERLATLDQTLPSHLRVPRLFTDDAARAGAFLDAARTAGHEGVVAKALDAAYEAGRRGRGWLKIKPTHTLDLVVLAAEWGHGRRRGWLSNLHLGARDSHSGGFVMLGKTFKGLTDRVLEWQTAELLRREIGREGHIVHVRPELVVEIAFNDVQVSPRYPAGLTLRFARVKGYRPDKGAMEADTIDTVRAIHVRSLSPSGPPNARD